MTAAEWFDQFADADPRIQGNDQWCGRHWSPCPVFGANGLGAAVEIITAALEADLLKSPGPVCCALGDDKMYEIWGHWPPAGMAS